MEFLWVTHTQILMPINIEGFFENKLRPSESVPGLWPDRDNIGGGYSFTWPLLPGTPRSRGPGTCVTATTRLLLW